MYCGVSVQPKPRGGFRHGKLKPHQAFILGVVAKRPDITMPELANVLLAVVQKLGVEAAKFADATGTLTGLV